ncbi:MAG TPA: hypothetical protein VH854_10900 [Thermoanaerobaculia bacterium]|jgi:hypothetical protein|nr:hypothetical protein [Thermoanaerobaculia bacterium]
MPFTQQELERFQQEFARRRQRQFVAGGLTAVGVLLLVLYDRRAMSFPLPVIWVAMVVGVLIFSWQNWRCPACDRYLGKYPPRFCPKCGVPLHGDSPV